ncbi:MAG: polysulfide reductase NrfD [Kiritimatiellaeota bacterium]|nr:polysulfide reductase NrfD [Kiritimatiellota bacterium]
MKPLGRKIAWGVWLALAAFGTWGVYLRMTTGHRLANYGSYFPWGLWVAVYVYFSGMSAGIFLLSMFVAVFRIRPLARLVRPGLFISAIALLVALLSISFDLGHMFRAPEVFLRPNFHSVMTLMAWLYAAYFPIILVALWLDLRGDPSLHAQRDDASGGQAREPARQRGERCLRCIGWLGIPLAVVFSSGLGGLFATLPAKPYWYQSLYPVLFLVGALLSGSALMLAVVSAGQRFQDEEGVRLRRILVRIVLGLLAFDIIIESAEILVPMWYAVGPEYHLYRTILFGRFAVLFWVVHVLFGIAVPLVLLIAKPCCRWAAAAAGILIAATFLAVRLILILPGEITPEIKGLREAYADPRLSFSYVPSTFEWAVVAFLIALGWAVFVLGNRTRLFRDAGTVPDKA